jgi:hypothetical protein
MNKKSFGKQLKKSEAVLFIIRIYQTLKNKILYHTAKWRLDSFGNPESWKNTEYFIKKISSLSKQLDAKLVVVIFPYRDQIQGNSSFEEQAKLKKILERNNISFFDTAPVLMKNRKSFNDASNLYFDNTHPNKLGTSVIADGVIKYLIRNELLDGRFSD